MDSDAEPNPYAAPKAAPAPLTAPANCLREGDMLLIRDGTVLPPRCISTGLPVGPEDWTGQVTLHWTPPEVWLLLMIPLACWVFGGPLWDVGKSFMLGLALALAIAVLAVVVTKKALLTYSLTRATSERLKQLKKRGFGIGLLGGTLAVAAVLFLERPLTMPAAMGGIGIMVGGIAMFAKATLLTVKRYKKGWFALEGCSGEFLDSL